MPTPEGPIIVWTDYGYDGWCPTSYPTIEKALSDTHCNSFVLTRLVKWQAKEIEENSAPCSKQLAVDLRVFVDDRVDTAQEIEET